LNAGMMEERQNADVLGDTGTGRQGEEAGYLEVSAVDSYEQ